MKVLHASPNKSLQRATLTIKCSAAGVDTLSASHHHRARVPKGPRAVAELNSWAPICRCAVGQVR
jgi:hypothetical protein